MYNRQYNDNSLDYEHHIQDEQMYRDAVRNLRWNNGKGKGEKWKPDEILSRTDVDFNQEYFTPYDYAYMVNAMYADYSNFTEKPEHIMEMTKEYLHNDSFPERGEERAYYDAERRARRYMNRYDEMQPRYEYNNRYGYNSRQGGSYNTYNNIRNTNRDRDNDGRYNEGR